MDQGQSPEAAAAITTTAKDRTLTLKGANKDLFWWKVYLRGAYGWSDADYQKWIKYRDPSKHSAAQRKYSLSAAPSWCSRPATRTRCSGSTCPRAA